jgi:hypothetical protein
MSHNIPFHRGPYQIRTFVSQLGISGVAATVLSWKMDIPLLVQAGDWRLSPDN